MNEERIAQKWLVQQLQAQSALIGLGVHEGKAPEGASFPAVVFAKLAGIDVTALGPRRLVTNFTYLVRAIAITNDLDDLDPLAAAIEAALESQAGAAPDGGRVNNCYRSQPYSEIEYDAGGAVYRHLGGVYRLQAQGE